MLLAVTPSTLARLGIGFADLVPAGAARVVESRFARLQDEVAVWALLPGAAQPDQELLTVDEMATRMQCKRATVYERERKGALFSVLPPGRENGRRFPAFQLHPRLDVALLEQLVAAFRSQEVSTNVLWDFLRSVQPALGGLTGIEFLTAQRPDRAGVDSAAIAELMSLESGARRAYVVDHALEGLHHIAR